MLRIAALILLLSKASGFANSLKWCANSINCGSSFREVNLRERVLSLKESRCTLLASVPSDFPPETRSEPPRLQYLFLWATFVLYAFGVSPGGSESAAAIDNEILQKAIFNPYDGTSNPVFVAVFNYLGILPAIYAGLLLPGAKNQTVPALPFVLSSFALGFFGIGPYLGLRNISTEVDANSGGLGPSALFSSKLTALLLLGFAAFLTYYATANTFTGGITAVLQEYVELFKAQRLVHVSTIDFAILSLAVIIVFG